MYESLAAFAQTWGLIFFVVMFGLVLYYALRPKNQKLFDHAARIPLDERNERNGNQGD